MRRFEFPKHAHEREETTLRSRYRFLLSKLVRGGVDVFRPSPPLRTQTSGEHLTRVATARRKHDTNTEHDG